MVKKLKNEARKEQGTYSFPHPVDLVMARTQNIPLVWCLLKKKQDEHNQDRFSKKSFDLFMSRSWTPGFIYYARICTFPLRLFASALLAFMLYKEIVSLNTTCHPFCIKYPRNSISFLTQKQSDILLKQTQMISWINGFPMMYNKNQTPY